MLCSNCAYPCVTRQYKETNLDPSNFERFEVAGGHTLWERAGVCTVCWGKLPYRYQLVEKWTVPLHRQDDAILPHPALLLIFRSFISPSGADI